MATLDTLYIDIKASASKANEAIDSLVTHFAALNGALNNFGSESKYLAGLNNVIDSMERLGDAINYIDTAKLKAITSGLNSVAKAGERMSSLTGIKNFANGLTSAGGKISAFSREASDEAKKYAERWGLPVESMKELKAGFQDLYASIGNDSETSKAANNIFEVSKKYSEFSDDVREAQQALKEIQSVMIKLPKGWEQNVDLPQGMSAKQARGYIGIAKSGTYRQGSTQDIIEENPQWGINAAELKDDYDAVGKLLEVIQSKLMVIQSAQRGWNDLSKSEKNLYTEAMQEDLSGIVTKLNEGVEVANLFKSTMSDAESVDDFMNIADIDEEDVGNIEKAATASQNLAESLEQVDMVGTAFDPIIASLRELGNLDLSKLNQLAFLKDLTVKVGGESGANAGASLGYIAQGLREFEGLTIPDFGDKLPALASGLRSLGSKNVVAASQAVPFLADGLRSLSNIQVTADADAISKLAYAASRFGLANMEKAVANIPPLSNALRDLIANLAGAPVVNENTIRLVDSLSRLNVNSANSALGMDRLSGSLKRYTGHARNAHKTTKSLAAIIGKIYASYWLLFRGIQKVGKAIDLASKLREVQNVVDVTFAEMSGKMDDFAKHAVDTLGMSELTAKQIGSRYQAMGAAMNIPKEMIKNTNEFVQSATKGYADVANSVADVSINLTKLAGDMASFYNVDYEDVAKDLEAVYTGMTRPLRKYGLDLTNATLKEFALAHGIDLNISKLSQAEKTMLRYQYVMANTTAAHGDFERTIGTWANQVRIAQERLKQLGIVLGQIAIYTFKPLVQSFNKAMETIIKNATATLNALGKIFGWQIEWDSGGVLQDEDDDSEELANNMGDAADNAKKFKNTLLGIDELNLLQEDKSKDKGSSDLGKLSAGLNDLDSGLKIKKIEGSFDSLYDTLYKLGRRIGEIIKDWLKNIDWDEVYKKARRFGKGLAQVLNGYLSDAELFYEKGRFIANAINTIAHAIDAFFHEFDGWQLGVDIGSEINGFTENLDWAVIRSAAYEMAHDIAQTINGAFTTIDWRMVGSTIANGLNTAIDFLYTIGDEINWSVIGSSFAKGINGLFSTFDFAKAGQTINKWAKGFLDLIITALDRVDWKLVGTKFGEFISSIDILSIASKIAIALWKAINAAVEVWVGLLETAPIETAIGTALMLPFTNPMVGKMWVAGANKFFKKYGKLLAADISALFKGDIFKTFGSAFSTTLNGSGGRVLDGFIDLNSFFGSGSVLQATANGFNAISKSLSGVTKALGTAVVGIAEFVVVKDAIHDIVLGTDDLGKSIAELGIAAGVASIALSALLGVPAGLIVAGAVAATAAMVGIVKATDELHDNNVMTELTRDMGDAYISMTDLNKSFKDMAENIAGPLDNLNAKFEKIESMKKDLGEMVNGFSLIGSAAKNGTELTNQALGELVGNIGEVKQAWEDYIAAQYDALIQSTLNHMAFIKSSRDLTDDEIAYFTNKINQLTQAKNGKIAETADAIQKVSDAWEAYNNALDQYRKDEHSISHKELDALKKAAEEAGSGLVVLAESSGLLDEFSEDVTASAQKLKDSVKKIDFSDLNAENYEEFLAGLKGYTDEYAEYYQNKMDEINEHKLHLELSGEYSPEEIKMELDEYYKQMDGAANDYLDSLQMSMFDKLYSIMWRGDYEEAKRYVSEIIVPFVDQFPVVLDSEGNRIQPYITEAAYNLLDEAYMNIPHTINGMTFYSKVLKDNWVDFFWSNRDAIAPEAKKAGEETGKPFAEGMEKTLNGGIRTDGAKKNVDDLLKRLKSVDEGFKDLAESSDKAASKTGHGVERMGASASAMVDLKDRASLLSSGLVSLDEKFGKLKDSGKGVEEAATGFKSIDGSAKSLIATFTPLMTVFTQSSDVMGDALKTTDRQFKELYTDILNGGMKVASWFKSSFIPVFSTQLVSVIPKAFNAAFSQAFNLVKSQWNQFAKWSDENMKITVKGKNGDKDKDNVFKLKVGAYETGGFPEDGLFFANHTEMVGKFDNGKTAVANNDQITEGIEAAVYRAMSGVMERFNGSQNVNVEITGDASDIFRAVVKENDRMIMRTGASAIRV